MSAVLLQYPLKPNELADDLESFAHVLTLLSLRFHPHTLTKHPANNVSSEASPNLNENNTDLASHVWHYYYYNGQNDGLCTGGILKMDGNKAGRSPWQASAASELDYVSPTLVTLISELFELIREHYSSIDFNSLSRYAPPPPKRKKSTIRRVMLTVEDDPDGELDEESDHEDQSTVVPVPAPVSGPAPPVRDLRSHDHIVKLFSKAFQLVRASAKQGDIVDDATRDQFYGLIEYTGSPKAGFKRSRTQASSMGGGTTQASSNSGSKRFKPSATSHGASHGLGPVPEGGEQSRAT